MTQQLSGGKVLVAAVAGMILWRMLTPQEAPASEYPFEAEFTVTNSDTGAPIAGAGIAVDDVSLTTNINGMAVVGLMEGTYNFTVAHPDYELAAGTFVTEP